MLISEAVKQNSAEKEGKWMAGGRFSPTLVRSSIDRYVYQSREIVEL